MCATKHVKSCANWGHKLELAGDEASQATVGGDPSAARFVDTGNATTNKPAFTSSDLTSNGSRVKPRPIPKVAHRLSNQTMPTHQSYMLEDA